MFLFRYTYIIYLDWIRLEVLKVPFYLGNEYDDIVVGASVLLEL
jgi:hypothetical protein